MADPNFKHRRKNPARTSKKGGPGGAQLRNMRLESNLTPEQEAYARGRAMGMSVTEAISAAGLSVTRQTAANWEKANDHVRDRIQELANIATKNAIIKTGLDREWVITRLMNVVDRCMAAEPVVDKRGELTGEYRFDSAGANAALKMLGDTMGLFKPAEKKPGDEYAELTDEDIARIAQELAAQTGLLEAPARDEEAAGPEQARLVQAVREADVVSRSWGDQAREVVPSREPAWEDVEFSVRSSVPSDGLVSEVVEGQALESWGDGVGTGRVDGIDPGHDAEAGDGAPRGVGDGDDTGRSHH